MQTREPIEYVGRFAPSPTGPLHFGSLVAAVASYLEARTNNGRWLLRIENIDPPREQAGATPKIIEALRRYGFEWDAETIYQSDTQSRHERALATLIDQGAAYPCRCSRRDLADAPRSPLGVIYPGTCRVGCEPGESAIRVRTDNSEIVFSDALQGRWTHHLEDESGDFVIRRRDGLIAYQLAVVVDDELQGVTDIVRGIDLMDSTARQIWLQRLLGYRTPNYVHIPVITHATGEKLSKLTGASAIPLDAVTETLVAALAALQQDPPPELTKNSLDNVWKWAHDSWQRQKLDGLTAIIDSS